MRGQTQCVRDTYKILAVVPTCHVAAHVPKLHCCVMRMLIGQHVVMCREE